MTTYAYTIVLDELQIGTYEQALELLIEMGRREVEEGKPGRYAYHSSTAKQMLESRLNSMQLMSRTNFSPKSYGGNTNSGRDAMQSKSPDRDRLASMWQTILAYADRREALFGNYTTRLLDRHAEDRLPHPGYVGSNYVSGGLLFLGMNPGAGGDGQDQAERPHYQKLRELLNSTPDNRLEAFRSLMEYDASWYPSIRIMRTIVDPVLSGTGLTYDSISYINVLKWRTAESSGLAPLYKISLSAHTLEQLAEIDPGTIAVLGVGVATSLAALPDFQRKYGDRCITIPRQRGDFSLPPEGVVAINRVIERLRSR